MLIVFNDWFPCHQPDLQFPNAPQPPYIRLKCDRVHTIYRKRIVHRMYGYRTCMYCTSVQLQVHRAVRLRFSYLTCKINMHLIHTDVNYEFQLPTYAKYRHDYLPTCKVHIQRYCLRLNALSPWRYFEIFWQYAIFTTLIATVFTLFLIISIKTI